MAGNNFSDITGAFMPTQGMDIDPRFLGSNPNTSPKEETISNATVKKQLGLNTSTDQKQAELNKVATSENDRIQQAHLVNSNRSLGDHIQDKGISLLQGAVDVGSMAYGLVDLATGHHLDDATDQFSANFNRTNEILDTYKSDISKADKEAVATEIATYGQGRNDRISADVSGGMNENLAIAKEEFGSLFNSAGTYLTNPGVAIDEAIRSLPQMIGPGAISSLTMKGITKKMSVEGAKRFWASPKGIATAAKIHAAAGNAFNAVSEGISNSMQKRGEILNQDTAKFLAESPEAQKLVDEGMTPREAQIQTANRVGDVSGAMSAAGAFIFSKVTGAGAFESKLLNKTGAPKKLGALGLAKGIIKKPIEGTVKETFEEGFQGASGEFGSNVATKIFQNKEQLLTEGLGSAAGQGAVVGGFAGAGAPVALSAIPAIPAVVKGTAKGVAKVAKGTVKAAGAVVDKVGEVKENVTKQKQFKEEIDQAVEKDDFNSPALTPVEYEDGTTNHVEVLEALLKYSPQFETEEDATNFNKKITTVAVELREKVTARARELSDMNNDPDAMFTAELNEELQTYRNGTNPAIVLIKLVKAKKSSTSVKPAAEVAETIANKTEYTNAELGSVLPNASSEQLELLFNNPNITEEQKSLIDNQKELNTVIKNAEDVSSDILEGNAETGQEGLLEHTSDIRLAAEAGNVTAVRNAVGRLKKFGKNQANKAKAYTDASAKVAQLRKEGSSLGDAMAAGNKILADANIKNQHGEIVNFGQPAQLSKVAEAAQADANILTAGYTNAVGIANSLSPGAVKVGSAPKVKTPAKKTKQTTETVQEETVEPEKVKADMGKVATTLAEFMKIFTGKTATVKEKLAKSKKGIKGYKERMARAVKAGTTNTVQYLTDVQRVKQVEAKVRTKVKAKKTRMKNLKVKLKRKNLVIQI